MPQRFRLNIRRNAFHRKGCPVLEQGNQGSSAGTIHGDVQETWMWHLRTQFNGECGGAALVVGDL